MSTVNPSFFDAVDEFSPASDSPQKSHAYEFADFEPDKAAVAALSPLDIARMTRLELVAAIMAAGLPVLANESGERLQFMDRWTLERMAYLARHCCRNQGY